MEKTPWIRQRETCKEVLSGLFIQEGSGTQARTIEGKTENETQVKNKKKVGKQEEEYRKQILRQQTVGFLLKN